MTFHKFLFLAVITSSLLSSLLLVLLNFIFGEDRAGVLASVLHLGNGIIVAALLGGFIGLWLALGGPKRAAWLAGTMIGLVVAIILWSTGQSYVWVIEAFLVGIFGKGGAVYTGLVATMILFGAMGWTTQTTAGLIEAGIKRLPLAAKEKQKQMAPIET